MQATQTLAAFVADLERQSDMARIASLIRKA
jgi:hypothetical protein